jgi:hypothetical protein
VGDWASETEAVTRKPITLVLVTGGRDYTDIGAVFDCLTKLNAQFERLVVIHGDADGADSLAYTVCKQAGIEQIRVPAAWNRYQRGAGPIRNQLMLTLFPNIDMVLAFPGGTGTADMKERAHKSEIPVIESTDLLAG